MIPIVLLTDTKVKYIENRGNIADVHEGFEDYLNEKSYLHDSTRTRLKNSTQTELGVWDVCLLMK